MADLLGTRWRAAWPAAAGGLALAAALGIGRFGFTVASPLMVKDGILTPGGASACVAAHFAGYFFGAIATVRLRPAHAPAACAYGLVATAALALALAFSSSPLAIGLDRFAAGVASGIVMVSVAGWTFRTAGTGAAPVLFGGVGLGIAAVGEAACAMGSAGAAPWAVWAMAAALAGALSLPCVAALMAAGDRHAPPEPPRAAPDIGRRTLLLVYATGGFGYVVSATYLPTIVAKGLPGLDPVHMFTLFGLAAAPSCWLWSRVEARHGTRRALAANHACQALGAALPVVSTAPAALAASCVLVGGTFIAMVALSMSAGRRMSQGSGLMASLTAAYALGQFAGPVVATATLAGGGTLDGQLTLAAAMLAAAAAVAAVPLPAPVPWRRDRRVEDPITEAA